jgi:hypothetical protein
VEQVVKGQAWWDGGAAFIERISRYGLDPDSITVQQWASLTEQLRGFPRHLSQHVGGFVIARDKLSRLVPIENAAMENRSVIQWDKDDLESLGLLKVDVLALGMLTAIRRALTMIPNPTRARRTAHAHGRSARGDVKTYDMICKADTIGVFQIESRAQQSMLPRLQPRKYYDLVEVAIVRPGPIQGGMVHPYLKRREAFRLTRKLPTYFDDVIRRVLGRTLGVPIFQEQVMQLAIEAAGLRPGRPISCGARWRPGAAWRSQEASGRAGAGADRARLSRIVRAGHLQADRGVWRIWLPGKPCGQLCQARLRQRLDQVPLPRGVPVRAAQQPADGLLLAVATGAGRAPAWRDVAARGRDDQQLGEHAGAAPGRAELPRRAAGHESREGDARGCRTADRGGACGAAIRQRRGPRAPRVTGPARH